MGYEMDGWMMDDRYEMGWMDDGWGMKWMDG